MFHVFADGHIGCDTLDEANQVLAANHSLPPLLTLPLTTDEAVVPTKRASSKNGQANSWKVARREAKRQGRDDIAAVRSELAAAKQIG